MRDPVALGAGAVLLALIVMAIFANRLPPADPPIDVSAPQADRLRGYPLAPTARSRRMLSRLMLGTRLSLFCGHHPGADRLRHRQRHRHPSPVTRADW